MNENCNLANPSLYPLLREEAKRMRKFATEAESVFWGLVRGKRLGVSFRRQYVIDQYIVDFVALKKHLIVELDGKYHDSDEQVKWDQQRTDYLNKAGFTVLRLRNEDVLCDTDNTIKKLKEYIQI